MLLDPNEFDTADPRIESSPEAAYEVYRELRNTCPVFHSEKRGGFYGVTRYQDIYDIVRNPAVFSNRYVRIPAFDDPVGPEIPVQLDAPEHGRYRRILDPMFTSVFVSRYHGRSVELARGLIADMLRKGDGEVEFIADFAVPFPCMVFSVLMGIPFDDLPQLIEWKQECLDVTRMKDRKAAMAAFEHSKTAVAEYFTELVEARRGSELGDEVIDQLIHATEVGTLTDTDIKRIFGQLFLAGLDTVTDALGLAIYQLAVHPEKREELVRDPGLVPLAVEELLRYDGSIVSGGRYVMEEYDLHGVHLYPGDRVMLISGASSRDEAMFPNPDEIDFQRRPN